jgi:hypothetical protein
LPTALRQHDVSVDDIDLVVLSHAHPDHIGGTIDFGGDEPVPAFPRARYPMAGAEWRFWRSDEAPAGMVPVVRPRLDALERTDRLELTDGELEVLPGLRLLPASRAHPRVTSHSRSRRVARVRSTSVMRSCTSRSSPIPISTLWSTRCRA